MSKTPLDDPGLGSQTSVLHELFVNHIRAQLLQRMDETRKRLIEEIDATISKAVDAAVTDLQSDIEMYFGVQKQQFVINLSVKRHE